MWDYFVSNMMTILVVFYSYMLFRGFCLVVRLFIEAVAMVA